MLYENIAQIIVDMVTAGTLQPGERVPSVRRLASQQRVSITTVLRAYEELEARGVIEARTNAGFYVRRRPATADEPQLTRPPSSARLVGLGALVIEMLQARGPDVVNFGGACAHETLMPTQRLQRTLASISRRHPETLTRSSLPPGSEELRRQIARRAMDFGCNLRPSDILITNGAAEALNLCLRAVAKPGDTVALESPTHFGILQILEAMQLKALEIPTHPRNGISLDALEFALQRERIAAVVVMCNAQNPLGCTLSDDNKQRLVNLLERHDVPLIEDDVYGDIYFGRDRPVPAKAYDDTGNVMLCSSFTKTVAPGMRIGWVAAGRWSEPVRLGKFTISESTAEVLQLTLAEFLATGAYDRQLRLLRRAFQSQVATASSAIAQYFPLGTRITRPAGGFVLWVEIPDGGSAGKRNTHTGARSSPGSPPVPPRGDGDSSIDCESLFRQALKHRVAFGPGIMFTATARYRNCLRIGCGEPWSPRLHDALRTLGGLCRKMLR